MKTEDFGWSSAAVVWGNWQEARYDMQRVLAARRDYQERRTNGTDEDAPGRSFPQDGVLSDWIKCPNMDTLPHPRADGTYKIGWEQGDCDGYYRIHYKEGPGDKAWMEERDGNYLARLEREGQVEKAAHLRGSLPTSHPHFRALTPAAPTASRSAHHSPTRPSKSDGAGAGVLSPSPTLVPSPLAAGAGMSEPDPLASAFEAQASGDHRQAIRLLDGYLRERPGSLRARKFRGFSRMKLAVTVSSHAQKEALLKSAKADYNAVLDADPMDDEAGEAIDSINRQLAPSPAAGAGIGAAPYLP